MNNQKETKENWRPAQFIREDGSIETFPNYMVSDMGNVMSLNYNHTGEAHLLKPGRVKQSCGTYYHVLLFNNKKQYMRNLHRLVLSTFCFKGYFKDAVAHCIDDDPSNCKLSNLKWTTQQENTSTEHKRVLQSAELTNRKDLSKRVRVTFLSDGHTEVYPSAKEVDRTLGLSPRSTAYTIYRRGGFYKKLNVQFKYIV